MGLSEREQKLFEQLERELSSDAAFAGKIKAPRAGTTGGKFLVFGVLVMLAGIALLVLAVVLQVAFFGVVAFLVMLIGLILASANFASQPMAGQPAKSSAKPAAKPARGSFFEDRWDRRFGE